MKAAATFSLWLLASLAVGLEPQAPAFEYELSVQLTKEQGRQSVSTYDHQTLQITGSSSSVVPASSPYHHCVFKIEPTEDGFDAIASEQGAVDAAVTPPREHPERQFKFTISSLLFPPNGQRLLRVRFADATDVYRLRYVDNEGLHIEPVEVESGTPAPARLRSFRNIRLEEDDVTWQCNPITTSAAKQGELLWKNDIGMDGQPASVHSLDKLLLIRTTAGHAFYVLKQTGEVVYYAKTDLAGKDPWEDLLPFWKVEEEHAKWLWRRHDWKLERMKALATGEEPPAMPEGMRERRSRPPNRFPLIRAAALLEDPRAVPLLIDCIGSGYGLQERAAAVAALEKLNGNATPWKEAGDSYHFVGPIPMERISPDENNQAEQAKWREVFGIAETQED